MSLIVGHAEETGLPGGVSTTSYHASYQRLLQIKSDL